MLHPNQIKKIKKYFLLVLFGLTFYRVRDATHERLTLMSGFLYLSIFDTFDDPSGCFRPILGHFCRFLTILMTLRAISGLF
jgi:hypothetical protein